jgi:hypothetical protein
MAIHAFIRLLDTWGMVTLPIEFARNLNYPSRTEFDTVSTLLTAVFKDMHLSMGNLNVFSIKWNPPEFHGPFLRKKWSFEFFAVKGSRLYKAAKGCQHKTS